MPKEKLKTIYVCTQCGETSPRWLGRCPSCGAWNTMTEDVVAEPAKTASGKAAAAPRVAGQTSRVPQKLKSISTTEEKSRIVTGISELDRVLGGGIVIGSVTLIGATTHNPQMFVNTPLTSRSLVFELRLVHNRLRARFVPMPAVC